MTAMVFALLAVLGVDLIVIVVLLGAVLARRRWVSHPLRYVGVPPSSPLAGVRMLDGGMPLETRSPLPAER